VTDKLRQFCDIKIDATYLSLLGVCVTIKKIHTSVHPAKVRNLSAQLILTLNNNHDQNIAYIYELSDVVVS